MSDLHHEPCACSLLRPLSATGLLLSCTVVCAQLEDKLRLAVRDRTKYSEMASKLENANIQLRMQVPSDLPLSVVWKPSLHPL